MYRQIRRHARATGRGRLSLSLQLSLFLAGLAAYHFSSSCLLLPWAMLVDYSRCLHSYSSPPWLCFSLPSSLSPPILSHLQIATQSLLFESCCWHWVSKISVYHHCQQQSATCAPALKSWYSVDQVGYFVYLLSCIFSVWVEQAFHLTQHLFLSPLEQQITSILETKWFNVVVPTDFSEHLQL